MIDTIERLETAIDEEKDDQRKQLLMTCWMELTKYRNLKAKLRDIKAQMSNLQVD